MSISVITSRQIQRQYRKLINTVKRTRAPIYLGTRSKQEAVLLDVETFERFWKKIKQRPRSWMDIKKELSWIRAGGAQRVNLAQFISADRQAHVVEESRN